MRRVQESLNKLIFKKWLTFQLLAIIILSSNFNLLYYPSNANANASALSQNTVLQQNWNDQFRAANLIDLDNIIVEQTGWESWDPQEMVCTGVGPDCLGYLFDNTEKSLGDMMEEQKDKEFKYGGSIIITFQVKIAAESLYFVSDLTEDDFDVSAFAQAFHRISAFFEPSMAIQDYPVDSSSEQLVQLQGSLNLECCGSGNGNDGIWFIQIYFLDSDWLSDQSIQNKIEPFSVTLRELYAFANHDAAHTYTWRHMFATGPAQSGASQYQAIYTSMAMGHYLSYMLQPWTGASYGYIQILLPNNGQQLQMMTLVLPIDVDYDNLVVEFKQQSITNQDGSNMEIKLPAYPGFNNWELDVRVTEIRIYQELADLSQQQQFLIKKLALFSQPASLGTGTNFLCLIGVAEHLGLEQDPVLGQIDQNTGLAQEIEKAQYSHGPVSQSQAGDCGTIRYIPHYTTIKFPELIIQENEGFTEFKFKTDLNFVTSVQQERFVRINFLERGFVSLLHLKLHFTISDKFVHSWVEDSQQLGYESQKFTFNVESLAEENQLFVPVKDLKHEYSGRVDEAGFQVDLTYEGLEGLVKVFETTEPFANLQVVFEANNLDQFPFYDEKKDKETYEVVVTVSIKNAIYQAYQPLESQPITLIRMRCKTPQVNQDTIVGTLLEENGQTPSIEMQVTQKEQVQLEVKVPQIKNSFNEACGQLDFQLDKEAVQVNFYPEITKTSDYTFNLLINCVANECLAGTHEYPFKLTYDIYPAQDPIIGLITIKVLALEILEEELTIDQIEELNLNTLDPQFVVPKLTNWVIKAGEASIFQFPERLQDSYGQIPQILVHEQPNFVSFDENGNLKIIKNQTSNDMVKQYKIRIQLTDSEERTSIYDLLLQIEYNDLLNIQDDALILESLPETSNLTPNSAQIEGVEQKKAQEFLQSQREQMVRQILGDEMLNNPQIQQLLQDPNLASSLYIVLTEFGKSKPSFWQSKKKVKPEINSAKVQANGKIEFRFNTEMITSASIKKMLNKMLSKEFADHKIRNLKKDKVLPLSLKIIQKSNPEFAKQVDLSQAITWSFDNLTSKLLTISVNFENPSLISQNESNQDQFEIVVNMGFLLRSVNGLAMDNGFVYRGFLPRQVSQEEFQMIEQGAKQMKQTTSVFIAFDSLQGFLLGGSLNYLISLVDVNMLIMLTTLFQVELPLNVRAYFDIILQIVKFELFQTEDYLENYLDIEQGVPYNDKFEAMGFESKLTIFNLGPMIIFILMWGLFFLTYLILKYLAKFNQRIFGNMKRKFSEFLFWKGTLSFILGEYVVLMLCFALNYPVLSVKSFGHRLNFTLTILFAIAMIALPVFGLSKLYKINRRFGKKKEKRSDAVNKLQSNYGMLFIGIRTDLNSALFFALSGYIRVFCLILVVFQLEGYLVLQFGMLFLVWVTRILMVVSWKPLEGLPANNFQIFEETVILIVGHHLMWLSILNSISQLAASYCGYSLIGVSIFHLILALGSHMIQNLKISFQKCKRKSLEFKKIKRLRDIKNGKRAIERFNIEIEKLEAKSPKKELQKQIIPQKTQNLSLLQIPKSKPKKQENTSNINKIVVKPKKSQSNQDDKIPLNKYQIESDLPLSYVYHDQQYPAQQQSLLISQSNHNRYQSNMKLLIEVPALEVQSDPLQTSATQIVNLNQARSVQEMSSLLIKQPRSNNSSIFRNQPKKQRKTNKRKRKLDLASKLIQKENEEMYLDPFDPRNSMSQFQENDRPQIEESKVNETMFERSVSEDEDQQIMFEANF